MQIDLDAHKIVLSRTEMCTDNRSHGEHTHFHINVSYCCVPFDYFANKSMLTFFDDTDIKGFWKIPNSKNYLQLELNSQSLGYSSHTLVTVLLWYYLQAWDSS